MTKVLVQCDFDGTITNDDTSFALLDTFAQGDWQKLLRQYKEHKISVGEFNSNAFAMVKASKHTLLEFLKKEGKAQIRPGFRDFVSYCARKNFRLVITSNGLDFYIRAILEYLKLDHIEVHAAQNTFHSSGIHVQYVGLNGELLNEGLKEAFIKSFLAEGYNVIYVGNGDSDIPAAKYATHLFARGDLLNYCKQNQLECKPFKTFNDIMEQLDSM